MKYIFVAGAPGSKWSSVVKNIYYSVDIDRSDYRDSWTYYHDASGEMQLMHLGAYFDPGAELDIPENLTSIPRYRLEQIFDAPFSADARGTRIIKSHVFSLNIDYLRETFPEIPIVLVHRNNDACLGWWVKCGHFDITYPLYHEYYKDLRTMAQRIADQNQGIERAWWGRVGQDAVNNHALCRILNIALPPDQYQQNYPQSDIRVRVI